MRGETVLITGASGGIGRALAHEFAAEGCDLVLAARSADRLAALADELVRRHGVEAYPLATDLSRAEAPAELVRDLDAAGKQIDVLVNNAGFGLSGAMLELDLERQQQMIRLNVGNLVGLTLRLVPRMLERGRGGVLNVASTASFQAGPFFGVYSATKAFVLSLTEALAAENRGSGLRVTCLCPGPTATDFAAEAGMQRTRTFRWMPVADAAAVARVGHRAFRRGRLVVVPGLTNKLSTIVGTHLPRALVSRVTARMFSGSGHD